MMRASSAPFGRGSKNQKFSFLSFRFSGGGVGGADKKWKGNFWFCFAATDCEMSIFIISLCDCLEFFISPSLRRDDALPLGVWGWLETLYPPTELRGNSSKWIVLGTNKSVCACPARPVRAQIPAVLGDIIKRRGLLP
jgi:hypothetical protein